MKAPATIPPVIVQVPPELGPVEICVRHTEWGEVEVDVRPAHTTQSWTPLQLMGGSFTVRQQ